MKLGIAVWSPLPHILSARWPSTDHPMVYYLPLSFCRGNSCVVLLYHQGKFALSFILIIKQKNCWIQIFLIELTESFVGQRLKAPILESYILPDNWDQKRLLPGFPNHWTIRQEFEPDFRCVSSESICYFLYQAYGRGVLLFCPVSSTLFTDAFWCSSFWFPLPLPDI